MKASVITFLLFGLLFSGIVFAEAQNSGVRAFEERTLKARPIPLGKVRLTGGPLKRAQDVTAEYLLQLEPDV